jgi:hypothetical protein
MTFTFSALFPDATDNEKLQQIRNWRNAELAACDWTQVADSTVNKTAWAEYRQALRDLPEQNADPKKIVFPTRPV